MPRHNGNDRQATQLSVTYRPLRDLEPYARNSRTHTKSQLAKIRASLARFGWTNPMLIAESGLIAGHARLAAAIEMAEANQPIPRNADPWTGPTIDLSHLSQPERRAYVIADNKLALEAGWDIDLLRGEFGDLRVAGFDLSLTGFNMPDISTILGEGTPVTRRLHDGLQYQVLVECADEAAQADAIDRIRALGLTAKPLIT
jgi:ParB-like chromosome segregation protein Spo0J